MSIPIYETVAFYEQSTAHHEAAHAIAHCLHGEAESIDKIVLYGLDDEHSFDRVGETRLKPNPGWTLWDVWQAAESSGIERDDLAHWCYRFVVNCLIGPAAEDRFSREAGVEPEIRWFDDLVDGSIFLKESMFDVVYDPKRAFSDIDRAFGAACLLGSHDDDQAFSHLVTCSKEADRLIRDDGIWRVIVDIAELLYARREVQGVEIQEMFDAALYQQRTFP